MTQRLSVMNEEMENSQQTVQQLNKTINIKVSDGKILYFIQNFMIILIRQLQEMHNLHEEKEDLQTEISKLNLGKIRLEKDLDKARSQERMVSQKADMLQQRVR